MIKRKYPEFVAIRLDKWRLLYCHPKTPAILRLDTFAKDKSYKEISLEKAKKLLEERNGTGKKNKS